MFFELILHLDLLLFIKLISIMSSQAIQTQKAKKSRAKQKKRENTQIKRLSRYLNMHRTIRTVDGIELLSISNSAMPRRIKDIEDTVRQIEKNDSFSIIRQHERYEAKFGQTWITKYILPEGFMIPVDDF